MITKRINLRQLPNVLKNSVISRTVKVKKIDKNSSIYISMSKENENLSNSHYIAFSSYICKQKRNKLFTFILLNSEVKLLGYIKLNSSDFKTMLEKRSR